jgi:hypothetical protein
MIYNYRESRNQEAITKKKKIARERRDATILSTLESRFSEKSAFCPFGAKKLFPITNTMTNEITKEKTNKPTVKIIFSDVINASMFSNNGVWENYDFFLRFNKPQTNKAKPTRMEKRISSRSGPPIS